MHTILGCLSKFNTSLACKNIYLFFVATENEKCIKNILNIFRRSSPYEKCINFIHFSSAVSGTDEKCINREKGTCIHFSQFIHLSLYQRPFIYMNCSK